MMTLLCQSDLVLGQMPSLPSMLRLRPGLEDLGSSGWIGSRGARRSASFERGLITLDGACERSAPDAVQSRSGRRGEIVKQTYARPTLTLYGSITDVTLGGNG